MYLSYTQIDYVKIFLKQSEMLRKINTAKPVITINSVEKLPVKSDQLSVFDWNQISQKSKK